LLHQDAGIHLPRDPVTKYIIEAYIFSVYFDFKTFVNNISRELSLHFSQGYIMSGNQTGGASSIKRLRNSFEPGFCLSICTFQVCQNKENIALLALFKSLRRLLCVNMIRMAQRSVVRILAKSFIGKTSNLRHKPVRLPLPVAYLPLHPQESALACHVGSCNNNYCPFFPAENICPDLPLKGDDPLRSFRTVPSFTAWK
jgi:hypothetical protein